MLSTYSVRLRTHLARKWDLMMAILADTDVALFSTVSLAILIVALIGIAIEIAVLWFRRSSLLQTPPAPMSQTQPPTLSPAGMPSSAPALDTWICWYLR